MTQTREQTQIPERAEPGWPPVVVASVFQTGLNLMRDLLRRGVTAVGVDCDASHEGFRSRYGKSYLCPNPDLEPDAWVAYMIGLAKRLETKPVIIAAADIFVSAIGLHQEALSNYYLFSLEAVAVQAALATKEQQYALAQRQGLPIPRTEYIQNLAELESFATSARYPCLIKPRHQREWDALPAGNPLRGLKLDTAQNADELRAIYAHTVEHRPQVMAQEIIAGGDDAKYCYLSVYGLDARTGLHAGHDLGAGAQGSRRIGYCVVREYRAYPVAFGSGSLVAPVDDPEIATLCDTFLRGVNYVGICEIEVKRDVRDGRVQLIEANPRYSVTADAAIHAGVDIGWLHYLDLIGRTPATETTTTRFGFRHIVLRRDIPALSLYVNKGLLTWGQIWQSYQGPLAFFDFDWGDRGPTWMTAKTYLRVLFGDVLRLVGLKKARG